MDLPICGFLGKLWLTAANDTVEHHWPFYHLREELFKLKCATIGDALDGRNELQQCMNAAMLLNTTNQHKN